MAQRSVYMTVTVLDNIAHEVLPCKHCGLMREFCKLDNWVRLRDEAPYFTALSTCGRAHDR